MSHSESHESPGDFLARVEAEVRQMPMPDDGPSQDVLARTLLALQAKSLPEIRPLPRRTSMFATLKLVTATLAASGPLFYFAIHPSNTAASFAEVAQKLREAQSIAYRTTTEIPDLKIPLKTRTIFKEPNLIRVEGTGVLTIIDGTQGKQLVLDPNAKTAIVFDDNAPAAAAPDAASLIQSLKHLTDESATPFGQKQIGEVQAKGYLVKKFRSEMTIWVDPATRLPVQIESSTQFQGKLVKLICSDFELNPKLDNTSFSVVPPAGYAVTKADTNLLKMDEKTFLNPEQATVAILRLFAEKTGGTFPKQLSNLSEFDQALPVKRKPGALLPDGDSLQLVQALTRFLMATRHLKNGYGYRSEGVKLGDSDKILFWYRKDDAGNKYRAVFGDLHAADVTEEKLPEKPKN